MVILTLLNTVHAASDQDLQNLNHLEASTAALSTVVGSLSTAELSNTTNTFAAGLDAFTQRAQDPTQNREQLQAQIAQMLASLRQTQASVAQAQQGISALQGACQQGQQDVQGLRQGPVRRSGN